MAVSFESAASEKHRMAGPMRRSSMKNASAQSVAAAANTSAWASELCAKTTGYIAVSASVASAIVRRPEAATAILQAATSASAAIAHMAVRVTKGEKPKSFQHVAR